MDTNNSNFVTIPAGTYRCVVGEVRPGTTRAGDERWSLLLRVAEGPHIGSQAAWDSLVFSTRGRARARMVFAAFGLPSTGKVQVEPKDLEGRVAMVTVRPATYQSPDGTSITRNEVPYDGYAAVPVPEKAVPTKKTPRSKRVAMFGEAVLQILQAHKEWGADTTDAIGAEAERLELAGYDDDGLFKVK